MFCNFWGLVFVLIFLYKEKNFFFIRITTFHHEHNTRTYVESLKRNVSRRFVKYVVIVAIFIKLYQATIISIPYDPKNRSIIEIIFRDPKQKL